MVLLLASCAPVYRGTCVPRAAYQALTMRLDYNRDVRLVVKNISPGKDHIQAQAWTGCEWRWVVQDGDWILEGAEEWKGYPIIKTLSMAETGIIK